MTGQRRMEHARDAWPRGLVGRARAAGVGIAVVGLLCWAPSRAAADSLPTPPDATPMSEAADVNIGTLPARVRSYSSARSPEEIRAFYEQALPKKGWKVGSAPWAKELEQQIPQLEHMRSLPGFAGDSAKQEAIGRRIAGIEGVKRNMLFASRDEDRLLITFATALDEQRTTWVFINQWEESASKTLQQEVAGLSKGASQAVGGGGAPTTSPCCSGEEVPDASRKLPVTIPRYPSGRLMTSMATPGRTGGTPGPASEMYLTSDTPSQVAAWYEQKMGLNGWTKDRTMELIKSPNASIPGMPDALVSPLEQMREKMRGSELLAFRKGSGLCLIVATDTSQSTSPSDALVDATLAPGLAGKPPTATGPTGRTTILVNYHSAFPFVETLRHEAPGITPHNAQ